MRTARYVALLFVPLLLLACEDQITDPDPGSVADSPLLKKCQSPPCNGGGGDPPPPDPSANSTILFSTHVKGKVKRQRLDWSLHVMDADGTNVTRLFSNTTEAGTESTWPHWAPDDTRFVFNRGMAGIHGVAVANVDGTDLETILESAWAFPRPRWSPAAVAGADGQEKIAYLDGFRDPNGVFVGPDLFVSNVDGSDRTRLTAHGPSGPTCARIPITSRFSVSQLEWSRSADRILATVYDCDTQEFTRRLYTLDCSGVCAVTDSVDLDLSASISSIDGFGQMAWGRTADRVVISIRPGSRGPVADLWILDLSLPLAPVLTQLTNTSVNTSMLDATEPTWSPDDLEIAFTSWLVDNTRHAFVMNADGTNLRDIGEIGNSHGMDWRLVP